MTSEPFIDYESLTQEALRGVVRKVLTEVAALGGLPGNHHFYISFLTRGHGVGVSKRLREQYPEEMTIVLQHRFWDLLVHDDRFEVKLAFNGIPERLVVPFTAIRVFVDPSVQFAIPFAVGSNEPASRIGPESGPRSVPDRAARAAPNRTGQNLSKAFEPTLDTGSAENGPANGVSKPNGKRPLKAAEPSDTTDEVKRRSKPRSVPAEASTEDKPGRPALRSVDPAPEAAPPEPAPTADVVSLDAFRKK
jgi:uncharacterized protein